MYDTTLGWRFPNPRMQELFPLESMGETAENIAFVRVCTAALQRSLNPVPRSECTQFFQPPSTVGWDAAGRFRYRVVEGYELRRIPVRSVDDLHEDDSESDGVSEA